MIDALPLLLGPEGYNIDRSVRLRSSASAYFNRTLTTPTSGSIWTYSVWVKRGSLNINQQLLSAGASVSDQIYFQGGGTDKLIVYLGATQTTTQVFRDPSSWYHFVFAVDTTQATASNRLKIYLNGTQITAFDATGYPTQNSTTKINSAVAHYISRYAASASDYFDGYLTEINFIDGQALDPSYFGETNPVTGVWQPKKYAGTYGTNGFYLPFNINTTSSYGASFNGSSQYLSATVGTSTIGSGDFTIEFWINSTSATDARMFSLGNNNATGSLHIIYTGTYMRVNYATTTGATGTKQVSGGGWHHYALVRSSNTLKSYVDGVLDVNYGTVTDNFNLTALQIGANTALPSYFSGTLSNFRITTTAVYTSNFTPATAPLTAITGTTLLTLQNATFVDNSTNAYTLTNNGSMSSTTQYPFTLNVSADASGNGNNWTPNNISMVVGVTYDSMLDVPTQWADGGNGRGNYAVMNPLDRNSSGTVADGNLKWSAGAAQVCVRGTFAIPSSGKWYMECVVGSASSSVVGVSFGLATADVNLSSSAGATGLYQLYASANRQINLNNSTTGSVSGGFSANDVLQIAVDVDNSKMWLGVNNTWYNSTYTANGDPATGANATSTTSMVGLFPFSNVYSNSVNWNFGQRPFSYTPPTGFKALNTQNLPEPTILKGNQYMDATLYTGDGTNGRLITNAAGFQPDLVWIKSRSNALNNNLYDSVRGAPLELCSNNTAADSSGDLTAFNSNGFTINQTAGYEINHSTYTYVGWQWKEGATQGFDIVTFTGGGAGTTINHSLGVAPKMIIVKDRQNAGSDWCVYTSTTGAGSFLKLNTTAASAADTTMWANTAPTSASFKWGYGSGVSYVAYLFSEVAGFSKFGSYVGNGSANGPFVYCGFRPRWIMVKRTDATEDWIIYDSARDVYNPEQLYLYPNSSAAEAGSGTPRIDFVANGFKCRNSGQNNVSAGTYIYAAFAETAFKFSLGR